MDLNFFIVVLEAITRSNLRNNNGLSTVAIISIIFASLLVLTIGVVIILYMYKSKNRKALGKRNKQTWTNFNFIIITLFSYR